MKRIIVVDDDQTNVSLIKMLLELDGFTVEACTTIESAKTATANGVDVFVVDVNLSRGTVSRNTPLVTASRMPPRCCSL
jgi:CheY-like chemotaxis protein